MGLLVLDCSVVVAWLFEDEESAYSEAALQALESFSGIVPSTWPLEIANTLSITERRGRIDAERVRLNVEKLVQLELECDGLAAEFALSRILGIARNLKLTAYDAAYLELARRKDATLATLDRKLRDAAISVRVPIFDPTASK